MGFGGSTRARTCLVMAVVMALSTLALAAVPTGARAGQWVQLSCLNPDGSSASSDGWAESSGGGEVYPAAADSSCSATSPMSALLPMSGTAVPGGSESLTYSPPGGSTLAGGTVAVQLDGDGYGTQSSGVGWVFSPAVASDDQLETCATWSNGCWAGVANGGPGGPSDFTGNVTLPSDQGGTVTVSAACLNEPNGSACDEGGSDGVWAGVWVSSADLLLSNNATPTGANFTGTILDADAHGTAQFAFTAAESNGPGIYTVSAAIDGASVYSATPSTNNGECVSRGTYPGTNALEFDNAQPCPPQESVDIPIDTTSLADGSHELTVTVTDAAGNSSIVYDGYISTDNAAISAPSQVTSPVTRTAPKLHALRATFVAIVRYRGAITRLRAITSRALPRAAKVTISDSGPDHPRLKPTVEPAARVKTLLRELTRLTFHADDHLIFTVTAAGKRRERIELNFHAAKDPTWKLLTK